MPIEGKKVGFLVSRTGIEQVELTQPWEAVQKAGAEPVLISQQAGTVQGFHHLDKADTFDVDVTTPDARAEDYAAVVLPGGVTNSDDLRMQHDAVNFLRDFAATGRPIAVICHGGWVLIEADLVPGLRLTSWPSMQTDFRNAGAEWVDKELVVSQNDKVATLISSRKPKDLDVFCAELVEQLSR